MRNKIIFRKLKSKKILIPGSGFGISLAQNTELCLILCLIHGAANIRLILEGANIILLLFRITDIFSVACQCVTIYGIHNFLLLKNFWCQILK
jgi:hypothetical protein